MSVHEISFPSANHRDTVKGWVYTPISKPKAVIQLIHGFGEHSRRYLHMIDRFTEAGYAVAADDHIGHGKTGYDSNTLGDPGTKGKDGWKVYLEDEKSLHDLVRKEFPDLPYVVFGHSWGSMLARGYAALYGSDLKALMLCGNVSQTKGLEAMWKDDDGLEEAILNGHDTDKGGRWLGEAFAGFTDRCENVQSANDWISEDHRIVEDHAHDPFNCFNVTNQLIYDFVKLYQFIEGDDWAGMVPKELPCYLISGDCDPCGNYGEGLYHIANRLIETGHSTQVHAYSGYRHEIHNERAIRDEVEAGLIAFADQHI
ncbi:MAG: lysophospholipase [Solobacterium sp.]|jgi:alpha-beta hydrolase superfamily lysophospholipase|nr:lysophospholipase [Solobacterium sp.]MCH4222923.1 lysophospholipase [Solobacterium sp.]MCH4266182.1 lysophospholipase [Solobacterium sp.]